MSVPPDRMASRSGATVKDPTKIMGVKKPVFYAIVVGGLILAFYIWRRSKNNPNNLQTANAGAEPDTTNGVTAADIGGTPADNSFATNTDLTALEEQLQALQNSLFQLQQSNGGNGAGLPGGDPGGVSTTPPGGSNTINPGSQSGGGQMTDGSGVSTPGGSITGSPPTTLPIVYPGITNTPTTPVVGPVSSEPIHYFGPQGAGSYIPPPVTTTPQTSSGFVPAAHTEVPGQFTAV